MGRSLKSIGWLGFFLILTGAVICACGGGGVSDLASTGGGTGGTGISVGSVSAFGSIYVNGVRYDTSNAEIFVEGESKGFGDQVVLTQLSVGMVVRVEGEIEDSQNGTAHKVYFNDDIRGPVESILSIDSVPLELTVLGKEIILQDTTQTGGYDLNSLEVGDWVLVSGFEEVDGRIRATFVTNSDSTAKANIIGGIINLNTITKQFEINGLVIDYQYATLIGINQLSPDLVVEVTGDLSADHSTLTADKIEHVDVLGAADSADIELEGIISEKVSDTEIRLDGVTVIIDAQAVYSGGDSSDVDSGVLVEVEGEMIGRLVYADKIIFKDDVKVEANVKMNNLAQSEIILAGLSDITIQYEDGTTKVTGDVDTTAAITDAHYVKIIGRQILPDMLTAIHIIVKSGLKDTVKLQGQGTLESNPEPIITILGHAVDLFSIPDENFESPEGVIVGYDEFLNLISTGDVVSAKGELTGDQVTWQSIATE